MGTLTEYFSKLAGMPANFEFNVDHGRLELERFVAQYPGEASFNSDGEVVFFAETEEFKIRSDIDVDGAAVYMATITVFSPQRVVFNTGYKSNLDSLLIDLARGAVTVYQDHSKVVPVAKLEAGEFKLAKTSEPNKTTKSVFIEHLKTAEDNPEDMSCLATVGLFFKKRRDKLAKSLSAEVVKAFDKALLHENDESYLTAAVERACKELF